MTIRSAKAPDAKGRMQAQPMIVPTPPESRRGKKIVPNMFWDPMPYALGVGRITEGADKGKPDINAEAAPEKFAAFQARQDALLSGVEDERARAFLRFLANWSPAQFIDNPDFAALAGTNVVFAFEDGGYLHQTGAALDRMQLFEETDEALCLVTGRFERTARLHPDIKGVYGDDGKSSRKVVSFNNDAETSYGHAQGDNAPTSHAAAFAYGTALNALLAKGSGRHLRLGDTTTVFWASAEGVEQEAQAEDALAAVWGVGTEDHTEANNKNALKAQLDALARGQVPVDTALDPGARVFILGLSPNAARIAVRFWHVDTLGAVAGKVTKFWDECAITPSPFLRGDAERLPRPNSLLYDIAAQHDAKNIPPGLAGDFVRAILTGLPYPATLLPAVVGRLRVEGDPDHKRHGNLDGRRAALIRAVLTRNLNREVPMALNETEDDVAYLLGRLFGAYVYAETSYQARGASLRAKYLGAASATPARVFPVLMRGYEHNRESLRKAGGMKAGAGVKVDRAVAAILDRLSGDALPATLPLEDQGRFFIGFYHQHSAFYAKAEDAVDALIETGDEGETE